CAPIKKVEIFPAGQKGYFPKPPRKLNVDVQRPLIVVDPGHGGTDEGAKVRSLLEKKMTLTTAFLTKRHLEELGYRVILTRSRDIYIPLPRRTAIANKNQGALFVSIHYNTAKNSLAKGVEIFYYSKEGGSRCRASKQLANCILFHLLDQTQAP